MSKILLRVLIAQRETGHVDRVRNALACNAALPFSFKLYKTALLAGVLELVKRGEVDAVILDLDLNDSHGIETLEAVRRANPDVPVVVVTDGQSLAFESRALASGAVDFISRSLLRPAALTLAVFHIVEQRKNSARWVDEKKRFSRLLSKARLRSRELSRLKTSFLANVSHEIRTPLNGIIGMTTLLRDTGLSPDQKEYVETLRRSGGLLMDLLNNILDLSKMEAGKFELHQVHFRPREVIEETMELFAGSAKEKGLTLTNIVDSSVPASVLGDAGHLRHILSNLIHNAIKFTERGYITVRAMAEQVRGEAITIRFEVADTGVGISSEKQSRLFDPFTQAHGGDRASAGSGLGLSISRRLANAMGGNMGVESETDRGSTFWFTVVFGTGEGTEYARGHLVGKRVLVVSEEPLARDILIEQLKVRGISPATVDTTSEALPHLLRGDESGHMYDLLLLSVSSKTSDLSRSLMADVQASPELAKLPVLLVLEPDTAFEWEGSARRVNRVLKAPIRQSQLYAHLAFLVGDRCPFSTDGRCRCPITGFSDRVLPIRTEGEAPRFLVVDDNEINRAVLVQLIRKLGLRVESASNGQMAVQAAEVTPYAAIFMDLKMPIMSGYDATTAIRDRLGKGMPIIATTAHTLRNDREKCLAGGFTDYLTKPVLLEDLKRVLMPWLEKAAPAREPGRDEAPLRSHQPVAPAEPVVALAPVIPLPGAVSRGPILDATVLSTLFELRADEVGRNLLDDMIRGFRGKGPHLLSEMKKAVAQKAWGDLEAQAHKFKGSCGNLGAKRLVLLCEMLEEGARDQKLDNAKAIFEAFDAEFLIAIEALERECSAGGSEPKRVGAQ